MATSDPRLRTVSRNAEATVRPFTNSATSSLVSAIAPSPGRPTLIPPPGGPLTCHPQSELLPRSDGRSNLDRLRMSPSVRVILADDAHDIRLLLRYVLDRDGGFEIVGEAADGRQAVDLAAA